MNIVDTFLDANGRVVTDPKQAVEMRRVEFDEKGNVTKTSVWYVKGKEPQDEAPAPKKTGYERPRGY